METRSRIIYSPPRSAPRFTKLPTGQAYVELELPAGGSCRLPLLNVSLGGICFEVTGEQTFQPGSRFARAVVRIGATVVTGTLTVIHRTESFAGAIACGGRFDVEVEKDAHRLMDVVESLADCAPE